MTCRNKKLTYDLFKSYDFCPIIFKDFSTLPVFIKPIDGQGGKGTKIVETENDVPLEFDSNQYIISEYLPGEELTVDCLSDSKGQLIAVSPRKKIG